MLDFEYEVVDITEKFSDSSSDDDLYQYIIYNPI